MKTSTTLTLPIITLFQFLPISEIHDLGNHKTIKTNIKLGIAKRMRSIVIMRALPTNAILMPILINEIIKHF
jgi:hypothetical protein